MIIVALVGIKIKKKGPFLFQLFLVSDSFWYRNLI